MASGGEKLALIGRWGKLMKGHDSITKTGGQIGVTGMKDCYVEGLMMAPAA